MMDKATLEARHKDELSDHELYLKMAEECPDFAGVFNDIAREEESHARLLKYILDHKFPS